MSSASHAPSGIADALRTIDPVMATEVRRVLCERSNGAEADDAIALEVVKRNVYRVRATADGTSRSVIVKRHRVGVARRNRLVAERWLPAIGLEASAPALLGIVAGTAIECTWLICEDVQGVVLEQCQDDAASVLAAVHVIAQLHTRAAGHPIVGECRHDGADRGMHYFAANVGNAAKLLQALRPPAVTLSSEQRSLRDRLSRRLDALLAEQPRRARMMAEAGGADTMLHGDLWTTNFVIVAGDGPVVARLIDWDHVGAGPVCYDLSTFLYRFERAQRPWILQAYREAVAHAADWHLPSAAALNGLSDTVERARYANRIIWAAIALLHEGADWGFGELAAVDQWFEALEPLLDV